jgi:hypothetical protein
MIQQEKNKDQFKTDFLGRPLTRPPVNLLSVVCVIAIIAGIAYYVKGDEIRPPAYDTSSTRIIRKTIKDVTFRRNDIIRLPSFTDSSWAIADFLNAHKNMKFEFSVHMSPTDGDSYTASLKLSQEVAENCIKIAYNRSMCGLFPIKRQGLWDAFASEH